MPKPEVAYAIGDIHGMGVQMKALLQVIAKDAEAHGKPYLVVFLGDMIDRGPDSCEVVALIKDLCQEDPARYKAILGNHEVMWLNAMLNPRTDHVTFWAENGGGETWDSYQTDFGEQHLQEHLQWLQYAVPMMIETDHHVFVHAGLRPHVPLAEQTSKDMLWIRQEFLHSEFLFEKHVIHGHSPNPYGPQVRENRTGLDTGCHYSGALTAGVFDLTQPGGMVRALQVKGKPA